MLKSEVKKIDSTKREINVEVMGERVKNKFEEVFKKITQEVKVPGFRPGHAPRDIIEKNYSACAQEQVLKELVPDVYHEAVAKEALEVIELPEIKEVRLDRNNLSFKAIVEVSPEIEVKNYKRLKVNFKKITVTGEEIKRSIDSLKESRKLEVLDDGLAKSLGYPNVKELEDIIQRQIFVQKENQQRQSMESEIIENITKDLDFKIPQSLVSRQLEDLVRQAKLDLALKGLPREKIEAEVSQMNKELEPQAKKQVKVYLVLAAIAKKENIALDDAMPRKVIELLLREADWEGAA